MRQKSSNSIHLSLVAGATALTALLGIVAGRALTGSQKDVPAAATAGTTAAVAANAEQARPYAEDDSRYKIPVMSIQPTLGPADALVTINEFCDLRGPACRRADAVLKGLMKEYEGKLRWAHRSRIDSSRPEAAHRMHAFARAAFQRAGKFWEMREQFLKTPDGVELTEQDYARITREVGLDYEALRKEVDNHQHDAAIALDNAFSTKFGVKGDLGIFVNGRPLHVETGDDMSSALKKLIDAELLEAEQLVQNGVAPERIYDEIIKDARWGVSQSDELARQAALLAGQR